ncbi:MAG: flap endonuclease-1 [Candidatus Thermoplasmatota archaeon]
MGVDIGDLFDKETCSFHDLKKRVIAIDGHNVLHQFISIIRQRDGTPLKDSKGRITSHLSGLFHRTANLVDAGVYPLYVFDGPPHPLKMQTIKERQQRREQAEREYMEAIEKGDIETARVKVQQTSRVTDEIIEQSKNLLSALGIPYVQAPSEGEAQASYMVSRGDAYGIGSQDYDSLLFGSSILIRNLTSSTKRKLPGKQAYTEVKPELIDLKMNLDKLGITREQLVDIAILIGTDFNIGINGIGPKKSYHLIKKNRCIENILPNLSESDKDKINNYREIRRLFLEPEVDKDYKINWGVIEEDKVYRILCDEHQFSKERVEPVIEKYRLLGRMKSQRNLLEF